MLRKYLYGVGAFGLAFVILTISFFQSASVKYAFATPPPVHESVLSLSSEEINYQLPYPGPVMPGSPFWFLKAVRDQIWFNVTASTEKRAELALLFADKRIGMSKILFEEKKPEIAFSTLTRAEKYLESAANLEESARKSGANTTNLLEKLTPSSLKHRQVIEGILAIAPEDARPGIIKLRSYSRDAYIKGRDGLNSKGLVAPINPFNGQ